MMNQIFWLKFLFILLFVIISIKGQVQENQIQNQQQTAGQTPEQNTGQIQQQTTNQTPAQNTGQTQQQTADQTQVQNTGQIIQQTTEEIQVQNQEPVQQQQQQQTSDQTQIQNQGLTPQVSEENLGQDIGIVPSFKFCKHYNGTNILLSKNSVEKYKNIDKKIVKVYSLEDEFVLDYHIRFLLQTEGLCYYNDERNEKAISKIYEPFEIGKITQDVDSRPTTYSGHIKYSKTINCYIYYRDNLFIQSPDPNSDENVIKFLNLKPPCLNQCIEYLESINSFISDTNLCTYPPSDMRTIYDNNPGITDEASLHNEIDQQRKRYYEKVLAFCQELNINHISDCSDESNLEVVNCGFDDTSSEQSVDDDEIKNNANISELKNQYCDSNNVLDLSRLDDSKSCCKYKYSKKNEKVLIEYKINDVSLYSGVSIASAFGILGLFYSIKYIKEIKVQESIKKSIINQERAYHQANRVMLENAKKKGFNPNEQVYNSTSRNLNTATLRNPRANPYGSMHSYVSSSSHSNNTVRYPTNSYTVIQDYMGSDERDISIRRGMIVQLLQKYEGGWVMIKDINTNRQGYAPEYCLGAKLN
ncbi:hypothetical protein BCR32DRAFT_265325 [Anaeromyces robustus]|uniref:SH3 domain-containing protein n=1 Tax=Anaeromyces robustus TaxID=1754192 RepID=A0A1Y1XKL8_9FUNG|nr:hypothetical protein BCR32DRAFT_265325 [Anaeromyces robustus]|eukprot:ORX85894.1 hypothetical protein BCR32DRAFT_265325 [Anaeromyces robustus]